MPLPLILASGSSVRAQLLRNAAVTFTVQVPHIDEQMIKRSLIKDAVTPRDIADTLAEKKARAISESTLNALVLGSDQVLEFDGALLSKPKSPAEALAQLKSMRGKQHRLFSAAVICEQGNPVWRHVGSVILRMRESSDVYLQGYVDRNWPEIGHAVGAYMLEHEGVRLFSQIEGDYFHVLGMPLLEILEYLTERGTIER